MLTIIEEYNHRKHGVVNKANTKYLSIGTPEKGLTLKDRQWIESCNKYKYLEIKITLDRKCDVKIWTRVNQERKGTAMLNFVLGNKIMSNKIKHKDVWMWGLGV